MKTQYSLKIGLGLVAIATTQFATVQNALAIAIASDYWFGSEEVIVFKNASFPPNAVPSNFNFLYRHWGDGTAPPPFPVLKKTGVKPPFPGWAGTTESDSHTTTHPKGSQSISKWHLTFSTAFSPTGKFPQIAGSLTSIADAANFTWGSSANTETDWTDPFRFTVPANTEVTIGVKHQFKNDPSVNSNTFVSFTPDAPNETGGGFISRYFTGNLTDESGNFGREKVLQFLQIGSSLSDISFLLGDDVSLDDGYSVLQKKQQLIDAHSENNWSLDLGDSILFDFTWTIPAVDYEREATLNMGGKVFAAESIPEPSFTLSLLTFFSLGAASTLKRKLKSAKSTEKA
jgi:hypothetical protein